MIENENAGISIHTPNMVGLYRADGSGPFAGLSVYEYKRRENPHWTEEQVAQAAEQWLDEWRADSAVLTQTAEDARGDRTNDILPQDLEVFYLADERYESQFKELADIVATLLDSMMGEALASFRLHAIPDDPMPYFAERELAAEALPLFRARWMVALEDALDSHKREREQ